MDREILLRQLVQAEQGVAEGKAFIAKQQRLIVKSERGDCHDTARPCASWKRLWFSSNRARRTALKSSTNYLSKRPTALMSALITTRH